MAVVEGTMLTFKFIFKQIVKLLLWQLALKIQYGFSTLLSMLDTCLASNIPQGLLNDRTCNSLMGEFCN